MLSCQTPLILSHDPHDRLRAELLSIQNLFAPSQDTLLPASEFKTVMEYRALGDPGSFYTFPDRLGRLFLALQIPLPDYASIVADLYVKHFFREEWRKWDRFEEKINILQQHLDREGVVQELQKVKEKFLYWKSHMPCFLPHGICIGSRFRQEADQGTQQSAEDSDYSGHWAMHEAPSQPVVDSQLSEADCNRLLARLNFMIDLPEYVKRLHSDFDALLAQHSSVYKDSLLAHLNYLFTQVSITQNFSQQYRIKDFWGLSRLAIDIRFFHEVHSLHMEHMRKKNCQKESWTSIVGSSRVYLVRSLNTESPGCDDKMSDSVRHRSPSLTPKNKL